MSPRLREWILRVGVAGLLAGGATAARAEVSDAWISAGVKMQLLGAPRVSGLPLDVDTDDGRVTLHGTVTSYALRSEVVRVARSGAGVASIRDLLRVVPERRNRRVEVADDRIAPEVDRALKAEPAFADGSVRSGPVLRGVVRLRGKAATLSDHLLALEVTSSVPGVRQVVSEIESPDEFAESEVWSDDTPVVAPPGSAVTDGWITAQTKMRLMTDPVLPGGDIHVDTRRGIVTLFGTVPIAAAADSAFRMATEVAGVRSVRRELRVVVAPRSRRATAPDARVAAAVRRRIAAAEMEGAEVQVEVEAATAHLSGAVQQASQRYAAVAIAHATPGVSRVRDDLRVAGLQTVQR